MNATEGTAPQRAPIYAVTYELLSPERDYMKFYDLLRSFRPWTKVTGSTYLISTTMAAGRILEEILPLLDKNDRVLVVGPLSVWACYNVSDDVIQWLRDHVAP